SSLSSCASAFYVLCCSSTVFAPAACSPSSSVFFFAAAAPTAFYTLSLHDALPICEQHRVRRARGALAGGDRAGRGSRVRHRVRRSEEHTSELQSRENLVCRLLLEKKNNIMLSPAH